MADTLLFHHAQGQTDGFLAFADELRAAGHTVHAPDLYDGKTFGSHGSLGSQSGWRACQCQRPGRNSSTARCY